MSVDTDRLTDDEVGALVRRAFDNVLARATEAGWFSWEDLPELGELDWERVADAFDARAGRVATAHDLLDEAVNLDRREIWARFQ